MTVRKRPRPLFTTTNESSISAKVLPEIMLPTISATANDVPSKDPPAIYVSHGCLLIPVFIAAWWYYTKQYCRSFVRGFLRNRPEHCQDDQGRQQPSDGSGHFARMEDAYFQAEWVDETASHREHTRESASVLSSNGFVKWINRRNVRRQFEKNRLRKTTNDYLYGRKGQAGENSDASSPMAATTAQSILSSDKSLLDTTDTEDGDNHHMAAEENNNNNNNLHNRENSLRLEDLDPYTSKRTRHSKVDEEWECIPRESHIELCMIPGELCQKKCKRKQDHAF